MGNFEGYDSLKVILKGVGKFRGMRFSKSRLVNFAGCDSLKVWVILRVANKNWVILRVANKIWLILRVANLDLGNKEGCELIFG